MTESLEFSALKEIGMCALKKGKRIPEYAKLL